MGDPWIVTGHVGRRRPPTACMMCTTCESLSMSLSESGSSAVWTILTVFFGPVVVCAAESPVFFWCTVKSKFAQRSLPVFSFFFLSHALRGFVSYADLRSGAGVRATAVAGVSGKALSAARARRISLVLSQGDAAARAHTCAGAAEHRLPWSRRDGVARWRCGRA
ncbi:hypothetical protein NDU88_002059 [Pleurodeles waltl]|uniref:Uncharacterized protein n=1 Tax=Pleurodeles waltl TaxID=8319 RepID=A0AAV7P5P5_PLEWA|nr:hypothetical protein NDU88_002059 [Pleurodeles waltl]